MQTSSAPNLIARATRALLGWRALALIYDVLPVLALWMLVTAIFTIGSALLGQRATERLLPTPQIAPWSLLAWLLWLCCWLTTGLYATLSWRHGGQTLGMRPWQLVLTGIHGEPPSVRAVWWRYAVATLSLLCAGAGFWWAWLDNSQLTWHDRASGTRMNRLARR